MNAKYIRVSTNNQNTDRQEKTNADKVYIDRISGIIAFNERPQAKKLINDIMKGIINEVEIHSIDRLGRNHYDIATTLKFLEDNQVNVIISNLGISSTMNGKKNPIFSLIANILGVLSEQERENLRERQMEGIQIAKLKGVYKGRTNGSTESNEDFLKKYKSVIKDLNKEKYSLREVAKLNSVSLATVQKVKKSIQ
ncbi:recombinase family protein [Paenimyroides viscosum]|uniref:Recombinase family protein n=1 Tax=Paenimyroides viscosum TaxID=2488729 RepID=A0A3P1AMK8_9FLAO|nr:recombinase family protein [Paenimyroides viscosum]RRA90339.1 recombinase family protein [Paenimyroides viscosum]